jgi:hypothetical protein
MMVTFDSAGQNTVLRDPSATTSRIQPTMAVERRGDLIGYRNGLASRFLTLVRFEATHSGAS